MISFAFKEQWKSDFCDAMAKHWPSESALDIRKLCESLSEGWMLFPSAEAALIVFDQWSHLIDNSGTLTAPNRRKARQADGKAPF